MRKFLTFIAVFAFILAAFSFDTPNSVVPVNKSEISNFSADVFRLTTPPFMIREMNPVPVPMALMRCIEAYMYFPATNEVLHYHNFFGWFYSGTLWMAYMEKELNCLTRYPPQGMAYMHFFCWNELAVCIWSDYWNASTDLPLCQAWSGFPCDGGVPPDQR